MSRRLVYLRQAEADLANLYDLIAADSPRAAFEFLADIRNRCESLTQLPRLGRALDGQVFRLSFDRRVTLLYSFDDEAVWISRVLYRGRRLP